MHNFDLLLTLTGGLAAALALGLLMHRLHLPPIVGYLMAGLLLGPHTPGFIANRAMAEQLAEVGVILLMFGVGLHFHVKDLLSVRRIAIIGALGQIAVTIAVTVVVARGFGWSWPAAVLFGTAISVASTVVLTRVLADNGDLESETGRIAVGWLIVEDIFTVLALVVLPLALGDGKVSLPVAIGVSALKLAGLMALTLGAGGRVIPAFLSSVARTESRELFTLTVLVIALGIAVSAAKVFGVSVAMGAFLAGMVVGQSDLSYRAASEALPMRDAFAVLFFVSVGMLFDPAHLLREPIQILATVAIVLVAKPLIAFALTLALGYGAKIGVRVAVALGQIGEFSFILASLGDQLHVLPRGATDSLIAASILSMSLNPLLYRLIPDLVSPGGPGASSSLELDGMNLQLENKTALVSGSSKGIGFAIASQLAAEGARVIVNGRTAQAVDAALAEIRRTTPQAKVEVFPGDLSNPDVIAALRAPFPSVDILVNNLGIFEPKPFEQIPDEDWLRLFDVNVMSGVRLSRAYVGGMKQRQWGRIIFISSESGIQIPVEMIHYGMTKTAQLAISRGLAEDCAGTGVTVNAILPGPTRSAGAEEFIAKMSAGKAFEAFEKEFFEKIRPSSVIRRFATVEEVANLVAFVCSPRASATTGAALRVDGGVVRACF